MVLIHATIRRSGLVRLGRRDGAAGADALESLTGAGWGGGCIIRGEPLLKQLAIRRADGVDCCADEGVDKARQQLVSDSRRGVDLAQPDAQAGVDQEVVAEEVEGAVVVA